MINLTLNAIKLEIIDDAYNSLDFSIHGWIISDKIKWDNVGSLDRENNTIEFIGVTYAESSGSDESTRISVHVLLDAETNEVNDAYALECNGGSVAAQRMDSFKSIKVAVACRNANGSPDFYITTVSVSQTDYALGEHYTVAEEHAEEAGYEGPFLSFDDSEHGAIISAAQQLQRQ